MAELADTSTLAGLSSVLQGNDVNIHLLSNNNNIFFYSNPRNNYLLIILYGSPLAAHNHD